MATVTAEPTATALSYGYEIDIPVSAIDLTAGTQQRAGYDDDAVAEYAALYREKELTVDAIRVVLVDDVTYYPVDGHHRVKAATAAGRKKINAMVARGTLRDAILASCGANVQHGIRRTPADKRNAVGTLLLDDEWGTWSDREIARRAGVGYTMVADLRKALAPAPVATDDVTPTPPTTRRYTTRHGTEATMTVTPRATPDPVPAPVPTTPTGPAAVKETARDQFRRLRRDGVAVSAAATQTGVARATARLWDDADNIDAADPVLAKVIELRALDATQAQMAESLGIPRLSVRAYLDRAEADEMSGPPPVVLADDAAIEPPAAVAADVDDILVVTFTGVTVKVSWANDGSTEAAMVDAIKEWIAATATERGIIITLTDAVSVGRA